MGNDSEKSLNHRLNVRHNNNLIFLSRELITRTISFSTGCLAQTRHNITACNIIV